MLPREKYIERGIDSLSDMELLAILVGKGIKGKNFLSISRSLLSRMRELLESKKEITLESIRDINGIGEVTGMRIICGIELGRRLYDTRESQRRFVRNSQEAYSLLRYIGRRKQEHVVALFLNSRFEVIAKRTVCIGTLDGVNVLPRDIIIPALEYNANSIVMAHNHPSGDCSPSSEDVEITRRISSALELVGLSLLDHIVISSSGWKRIEI
ncbi:MAG TPA: DNA repair protein RadC [Candidatus Dojkabacteria bacterium]|jgi:DNA repair protein RadC|nr:DNA repair protein RadC [Candidatus Dojkabacteria bacterium]